MPEILAIGTGTRTSATQNSAIGSPVTVKLKSNMPPDVPPNAKAEVRYITSGQQYTLGVLDRDNKSFNVEGNFDFVVVATGNIGVDLD